MVHEIAFLAISQAHQFMHWLPAALRLAAEPGVRVTVLVSSSAGKDFIRSYDPDERLQIKRLHAPTVGRHGLFSPPPRLPVLLLNARSIARYPTIVTTETTSSVLRRLPGFRSKMVHLKHGAGDREGGYNPKHAEFDLTLVNGPKDKQRLIERGLANDNNCIVVGYGKFELVRQTPDSIFANNQPIALYNPHFDKTVGTWARHGRKIVRTMESIPGWNFVVAPHVKAARWAGHPQRCRTHRHRPRQHPLDRHELHAGGERLHRRRVEPGLRVHPNAARMHLPEPGADRLACEPCLRPLAFGAGHRERR